MVLLDPIQRGEQRAERAYDEATKEVPAGKFRCQYCSQLADEDDCHPISPDPWAMGGCGQCLEGYMKLHGYVEDTNIEPEEATS